MDPGSQAVRLDEHRVEKESTAGCFGIQRFQVVVRIQIAVGNDDGCPMYLVIAQGRLKIHILVDFIQRERQCPCYTRLTDRDRIGGAAGATTAAVRPPGPPAGTACRTPSRR